MIEAQLKGCNRVGKPLRFVPAWLIQRTCNVPEQCALALKELGGAFGVVCKADFYGAPRAAKPLSDLCEAKILRPCCLKMTARHPCLTSSNKKLLVTSATLVVTGALLVVTRSY